MLHTIRYEYSHTDRMRYEQNEVMVESDWNIVKYRQNEIWTKWSQKRMLYEESVVYTEWRMNKMRWIQIWRKIKTESNLNCVVRQ